jgi:sugar (pentulose or hexulose) kinase
MRYVLGVDVGTTKVKAVVLDDANKVVSFASGESKLNIWGNYAEQDPEEIWHSVVKVIKKIIKHERIKKRLVSLSLSTQGGTVILVDKDNKPLRAAITWMDTRAIEEGKELIQEYGSKFFYNLTGWTPDNGYLPLSQLLWLQRRQRDTFRKINKCHFVDSYLIYRLTGKKFIDSSNAAITMLYDIKRGTWSKQLLDIAGIKEEQLPYLIPSGKKIGPLTRESSRSLGLPKSVLVYSGGHDQYCAALGAGVRKPGEALLSAGTAWVILAITKKPIFSSNFSFSPGTHVINGLWGVLTSILCGGASLNWFLKNILSNRLSYEDVDSMVRKVKEVVPVFQSNFTDSKGGAFTGINLSHTTAHFLRSIMEGLSFEVGKRLEDMKKDGINIKKLKMVGGGAKSSVWPRIISEATKLPVLVPDVLEVASIGVRAIEKEDICKYPNPDFKIRVIEDDDEFNFEYALDIFYRIKRTSDEGKKLVLIFPQPAPQIYRRVACLINKFEVSCKKIYVFNMDEKADEDGKTAPENWFDSFAFHLKNDFFYKIDKNLRPPEDHVNFPTDKNINDYGKMIEDAGGADVCYGGIGWSGHLAYCEPDVKNEFRGDIEAWKKSGPRIVELTFFTVLQNGLYYGGDWSWESPKAATIGPAQIVGAKLRSSWNGFCKKGGLSWNRFIVRLAAHGPVNTMVPASILQTCRTDLIISGVAAGNCIEKLEKIWEKAY